MMNPWFAKAIVLAGSVVMVAIRAPHGHRSCKIKVAKNRKGKLEVVLLTFAWLGFFLPLIWIVTPFLAFADYPLHPIPFIIGCAAIAAGLRLFHRSHADLGTNWSITLEVRENHRLIMQGSYGRVRHPMYLALLLYSGGQAVALPNWVAGPSYFAAFALLFAFRVGPEERMMREAFGREYEDYIARTKRLIPGIW